jgi:hypothetical protein
MSAGGLPYFAWIDVSETTFTSGHLRWDEDIFSFKLSQDEGDPASLTVVVRKPRNSTGDPIGLLGPGRKIWCWFALDCGPALIKFRGRLVGIPTSIFEEQVTLEFVAKPVDVVAQKDALAASLRVLPFYDEAVIDPARATDPDVVLEGYTAVWHYDRETHVISISDEITGEDGTVSFDGASEDGKVLYDGLGLTLTSGPLARVDVNAEYTWTQQARGTVDLTRYLTTAWPGAHNGIITSYSMTAADWPKNGAGIGDGWVVDQATAYDLNDFTVKSITEGSTLVVNSPDGSSLRTTFSSTTSYIGTYTGQPTPQLIISDEHFADYQQDEDGTPYVASFNRNFSAVTGTFAMQAIKATLVAGYTAERQCTERVSFSLYADVQPILTDPEDGEALLLDGIRSVNLSEGGQIGDPRRRSYIATPRGNQSLEYLIAFARTHLMKRARVVEIAFVPKLSRMPEVTLRKSAFLAEPRVGEALGKIIGYSIALDGADGRINCEVRIGCPIGRGGVAIATDGRPTYCTVDYAGYDYQQFVERTVLVGVFNDTSVGYQPPSAAPNDDGIDFLSTPWNLRPENVIEQSLVVKFGPDEQAAALEGIPAGPGAVQTDTSGGKQDAMAAYDAYYADILKQYETHATFKLKSMTGRDFTTNYEIQVTDLKIPTGYDLEAV